MGYLRGIWEIKIKNKNVSDNFEKTRKRKLLLAGLFLLLVVAILIGLYFLIFNKNLKENKSSEFSLPEDVSSFTRSDDQAEQSSLEPVVEKEPEETSDRKNEEVASSENFQIKDVRFGGAVAVASGNDELTSLEIFEIKGNTVSSSNKKDNKILITWKTNKMAISTVEYAKNDSASVMKFNETGYGFNHGIVLSGLEPGTRYVYSIKSTDRWGNEKSSEKYAVYISNPAESIVDIISKELDSIFGWAIKK